MSLNIPKSSSSYSESTIEGSGNSEGGLGSRKESSSKVMFGKPGTEDLGTNMRKLDNGFFCGLLSVHYMTLVCLPCEIVGN
ncbi:MAG: hypothetical protein P0116_09775 [Candidatus Nitrosocosmicus sp.]|nr:hypothetical protein [Candidatus Nitrosocosmicus sp.]